MALVRSFFRGAIPEYGKSITTTKEESTRTMLFNDETLGADAVLSVSYTTSMVGSGSYEVFVHGTAVKLK